MGQVSLQHFITCRQVCVLECVKCEAEPFLLGITLLCRGLFWNHRKKPWHSLHSHRDEDMTRRTNFLIVHYSDSRRHWKPPVARQVFLETPSATCSPKWAQRLPLSLTKLLLAYLPPYAPAVVGHLCRWRGSQHLSKEHPSNACKCDGITQAVAFIECSWDFLSSSQDQPAQ